MTQVQTLGEQLQTRRHQEREQRQLLACMYVSVWYMSVHCMGPLQLQGISWTLHTTRGQTAVSPCTLCASSCNPSLASCSRCHFILCCTPVVGVHQTLATTPSFLTLHAACTHVQRAQRLLLPLSPHPIQPVHTHTYTVETLPLTLTWCSSRLNSTGLLPLVSMQVGSSLSPPYLNWTM